MPRQLLILALAACTLPAHANGEAFDLQRELVSSDLKGWVGEEVALFAVGAQRPAFAETTRAEVYSARSFSPGPFGGSRRHCVNALHKAVKEMVDLATARGYDAVVDIQPVREGDTVPTGATTFLCKPGYKITSVSLSAALAKSSATLAKEAEAERQSLQLPARPAADGAVYLPVGPMLKAPELQALLPAGLALHWGAQAPDFSHRHGPDDYSDSVKLGPEGAAAACQAALAKVLKTLVETARTKQYNAIGKLRSRLYEEYTPALDDLECAVDKKSASVTLQATLLQTR